MAGSLALLLGLALAADASVEAGVRAEVRGRNVKVPGSAWTRVTEAAASPRLEASVEEAGDRLVGTYEPLLVAPDVPGSVDVLHVGRLEGELRPRPSLTLGARGAYVHGESSLVREARQRGEAGPIISSTGSVSRTEARVALDARSEAGPATLTTAALAVEDGGGDGERSAALVPQRRAWLLDATWSSAVARHHTAELALAASDTRFDLGTRTDLATLTAGWRHLLAPRLEWHASASLGAAYTAPVDLPPERSVVVGGEAGLVRQRPERRGSDRLVVRATPQVDRLTGTVEEHLEAELRSEGDPWEGWFLGARAVGGLHLRDGPDVRTGHAEVRLERRVHRHLLLGGGLYGIWQVTDAADLPTFYEGGAFLSLEWRTRPFRSAPTVAPGAAAAP